MSETTTNEAFTTPTEPSFDTLALQGSMQQILSENLGSYVDVEFLIGTQSIQTVSGLLYSVGVAFIVLYDDLNLVYIVCDLFSIKFVTFYLPGYRPGQVSSASVIPAQVGTTTTQTADVPALQVSGRVMNTANLRTPPADGASHPITPGQAAYAHIRRKTR